MHYNGESIEFMKKLRELGRKSALDDMPILEEDAKELWQIYCFIGDEVLISMDVYERKIGLPLDWGFEECVILMGEMKAKKSNLVKNDRENK